MIKKKFDYIKLCLGYPSNESGSKKIIWRRWNSFKILCCDTEKFGHKYVYAIDVSKFVYKTNQHLAPKTFDKKVLTLNLDEKYFEKIRDGIKKYEYREIKSFWTKRLYER